MSKIRIERIIRIVQEGEWPWEKWVKHIVDHRYFIDGRGPFSVLGEPFKEPAPDSAELVRKWKWGGRRCSPGVRRMMLADRRSRLRRFFGLRGK